MKGNTVYFILAAILAVIVGAVWCFEDGPCSNGGGDPTNPLSAIGGAISNALSANEQDLANADATGESAGVFATVQGAVNSFLTSITDTFTGVSVNSD